MRLTKPIILVFLGPQGSGKGTQSQLLAQALGLPRAEAGQLFRDEALLDTPLAIAIKSKLDKGEYLSTDLWKPVIERKLRSMDGSKGMIFDGFLRTADQLAVFEEFRTQFQLPEAIIVYLNLSREQAVQRLIKRGRVDDTPELITKRLEWSTNQVQGILSHFRKLNKVIDIDANHEIEVVQQTIQDALQTGHYIA